ncbi:hypothetical protein BGZ98_002476, partial [Dissophora globulifera]
MDAEHDAIDSIASPTSHEAHRPPESSAHSATTSATGARTPPQYNQDEQSEQSEQAEQDDQDLTHCVICLNPCEDRTALVTCHHEFCFHCILQWSMISHSCPLCVQTFDSCIHNIQDDGHYAVHRFEALPSDPKGRPAASATTSTHGTGSTLQQISVPYGIIRQLYGPSQRRRRFRSNGHSSKNETLDERSVADQQQQALDYR